MQTKVKVQTVPYISTAKAGSFTEHLVIFECFVVARGSTMLATCALPSATGTILRLRTTISVFVVPNLNKIKLRNSPRIPKFL